MWGVRTVAGFGGLLVTASVLSGCGSGAKPTTPTTPARSAASIAAGTPWQPTASYATVKGSPDERATVGFAKSGSSVVSWLVPRSGHLFRSGLVGVDESGAQASPAVWPKVLSGPPVVDSDEQITAVGYDLTAGGEASHLRMAKFAVDGSIQSSDALSAGSHEIGQSAFASDDEGNLAVVWIELSRGGKARLRASFGTEAAGFGPTTTLQSGDTAAIGNVAVSIVGSKAVVAADSIDGAAKGVAGWIFDAGQLARGPLPVADHRSSVLRAAMSAKGRAFVAIGSQSTKGNTATSPWVVAVSSIVDKDLGFSPLQTLDPGGPNKRPTVGLALGASPDGRATLAWTAVRDGGNPVLVASSDASTGVFGGAQQLAVDQQIGGLAFRSSDGLAVITTGNPATKATPQATASAFVRPARAAKFGTAERLPVADDSLRAPAGKGRVADEEQPGQEQMNLAVPAPAFNQQSGRPSVAYVVADAGGTPGHVQVASRDRP